MKGYKTIKMYEIRYSVGSLGSQRVGNKGRLINYRKAQAVARRLRKAGVDAFVGSSWKINIKTMAAA